MYQLLQINLAGPHPTLSPWWERMGSLAALVTERGVDVIVAQAGFDAGGDPGPRDHLLALLPGFDAAPQEGLLIASRIGLDAVRAGELTRLPGGEDASERVVVGARVRGVMIVNAYVSWVEAQATRNVAELLAFADTVDEGEPDDAPALIVGDFNQEPASPALSALPGAGFSDAWTRVRHGEAGFSYEAGVGLYARLDQLWERSETALVTAVEAIDTGASNHLALLAKIDR